MICFEVEVNSEKVCTAGIGEFGVLTSCITWVNTRERSSVPEGPVKSVSLDVGGLTIPENDAGEFVNWSRRDLKIGDEVRFRIVEAVAADEPAERNVSPSEPVCSFCGKSASKVLKIIKAQQVNICNECVAVCNRVIADDQEPSFGKTDA
jgi:hypothetical protein